MFLLFINDMPSVVNFSSVALFADDSKCFNQISCRNDCLNLQNDLNNLFDWSLKWMMSFNPDKCKIMSITRSRQPVTFPYSINGVLLEHVGVFKDLGIAIDSTLSFTSHVQSIVSKSLKVCGMIKRSIGFNAPVSVKLQLFKSLCISVLESSSQVWSPQSKVNVQLLESVQRSMTRYILNCDDVSYTERCFILNILPLSFRREIADLLFIFKQLHGLSSVDFTNEISSSVFNNNAFILSRPHVRTESFLSMYFNRIVHLWNILPASCRSCTNFSTFKSSLLLFYQSKLPNYDISNSCTWTSTCRCNGFYH
jgi:hypothetical protein